MTALSIDLWDEPMRAKIEALQWQLAQDLLRQGLMVVIEWGTWGRSERDGLRLWARALGAAVEPHYVSAALDVLFDRVQRRGREAPPVQRDELIQWPRSSRSQLPRRWLFSIEPFAWKARILGGPKRTGFSPSHAQIR